MLNLKVLPKGTYKTTVKVLIPTDFDKHDTVSFQVEFKRLVTKDDSKKFFEELAEALKANPDLGLQSETLRRGLISWSGLKNADDKLVEFSPEALEELLLINSYRQALYARFMEDQTPPTEPARKN